MKRNYIYKVVRVWNVSNCWTWNEEDEEIIAEVTTFERALNVVNAYRNKPMRWTRQFKQQTTTTKNSFFNDAIYIPAGKPMFIRRELA